MINGERYKNLAPVFFLGHGNPMNAINSNSFTRSLNRMGNLLQWKPDAILVISAHWLTMGTYVSTAKLPELIYDFSGFPDDLNKVKYPAPGAPEQAKYIMELIPEIKPDDKKGLDHGTWSMLVHMFPDADIPVFQLSIDYKKSLNYHYNFAKKLYPLREKNIVIIGSGNIVHNLRFAFPLDSRNTYEWAIEFDSWVKEKLEKKDFDSLINYEKFGEPARLSVPTIDHYIPLIYCIALANEKENVEFTYEEIISSISMRSFKLA